jgi:polar amino acid transport system permease protein
LATDLNFGVVFSSFPLLLAGTWLTLKLTMGAMVMGLLIAIFGAWAKTSGPPLLKMGVSAYVEVIRNTPFLAQIFLIFFGLPALGIRLSPNTAALVSLVINVGAYATEIIRAGIESIAKGQVEAGFALGLRRAQIFRHIVLKPALRTTYPALTSQFIYLMLGSSVVSAISANDLAAAGDSLQSRTFASFEVYLVVTFIYLGLSIALSSLFSLIERISFRYPLGR